MPVVNDPAQGIGSLHARLDRIASYLNGTDLPLEVYASSDPNELIGLLATAWAQRAASSPTGKARARRALYLYGRSAPRMRELIEGVLASHPLAQRSRLAVLT